VTIVKLDKKLAINPLKVSQTLGGVLALQGLFRAIPLVHGSQGCAAFIKALMTQHYREPVSIQTTALQEMNIIFGGERSTIEAMETILNKHHPSLMAVLSTGLTETAGDDLIGTIKNYLKTNEPNCFIFPVALPDFEGSLESGFQLTVEAMIRGLVEQQKFTLPMKKKQNQINLLAGSFLTAGDVMEIKKIIQSFGFSVITAPDISTSLTGSLQKGFSPLSQGGATREQLQGLFESEMTIVVGTSLEKSAQMLEAAAGIPYRLFPSLTGLKANDEFFSFLQSLSGKKGDSFYQWERDNLLDCILDSHFYFSGKKIVIGLEPDHLFSIVNVCKELGGTIDGLVSSFSAKVLSNMEEDIFIGDLDDLETMADNADLWISNSHGEKGADRKNVAFLPIGFPIFHQIGSSLFTSVGYRGTTNLIIKMSNLLM